jgi:transcriptional regulator with XRE-family HTH domain
MDNNDPSIAEFNRAVGHRLAVIRAVVGITEIEAARAARITLRTWRKWEAGRGRLSSRAIMHFAHEYRVSLDWLLDGEAGWIGEHLAKRARGKVAILPAGGPRSRAQPPRLNVVRFPSGAPM